MGLLRAATSQAALAYRFRAVRRQTEALCAPLSPEDMMVQACEEASPAKWHLAHTTWFFETFVLAEFLPGYTPFHPDFHWLFNSYYNAVSGQPQKRLRSVFSRPSLDEILEYRRHVDAAMGAWLEGDVSGEAARRVVLGLNHEQQHQELLVYDVKSAFWANPLRPAYCEEPLPKMAFAVVSAEWVTFDGGLVEIGHGGEGFCFDNEQPQHKVYLKPFALASRLVTCGEYLNFMRDGGYERPELWLSDGWNAVQTQGWRAPLYWFEGEDQWRVFTLHGAMDLADLLTVPVCHVSWFEAEAFARWAGARLPNEAEWETAAAALAVEGNFLESGLLNPAPASGAGLRQMFGDVWEWTASAYLGYPGYAAPSGALGEYNGKFMSGQMVLRGGSTATPATHARATYRNFFPPASRWQFSGLRLAQRQE